MSNVRRLVLLNQMAGPLFRQLAEGLAPCYAEGALLLTGHPDTLAKVGQLNPALQVIAAPAYNRRSRFHRVFSWICYMRSATRYILCARKGDVVLLVSNPPLLGFWVCLLSLFRSVPYGVLVYDIYPDVFEQMGLIRTGSLSSRVWRTMNRQVYRRAKTVITIGNRMASRLQLQLGLNETRVAVVPPWADVDVLRPLNRMANPYVDRFIEPSDIVVLYSGNMGASHDIDSMLMAAQLLCDEKRIRFLFIGDGEKRGAVEAHIHRYPDSNVRYYPFQPEAMLPYTLSMADISLVSLDEGMEDLMVPSKVFSYMAAGSAILAISNDDSELADVVDGSGCGLRVAPRKPDRLAETLRIMIGDPEKLAAYKRMSRVLAENRYSQQAGVRSFGACLEQAELR